MIRNILIALVSTMLAVSVASADTWIPAGNVSGTWTALGSPYWVQGNITVTAGNTLTIEPAVEVEFQGDYSLTVNGYLEAVGTEVDSIHFFPADTSAGWGGIGFVNAPDSSHLAYCTVKKAGSISPFTGEGGIRCSNSNPLITHCTISDNRGGQEMTHGGGISITGGAGPEISHCTISGNVAVQGGGILITDNSWQQVVITDCNISNNSGFDGGGICLYNNSNGTITDCIISNNSLGVGYGGGGIYGYWSSATITNCVIRDHTAGADGGGMLCWHFDATLTNCTFSNNSTTGVDYYGGGIACIYPGSNLTLSYCTFDSNTAGTGQGGAIGLEDDRSNTITIDHCTFYNNRNNLLQAEAIYCGTGNQAEIHNSIFAENGWRGAIHVQSGATLSAVTYTDFYGNNNNIWGSAPANFGVITTTNTNGDPCDQYYNIFEEDPLFADPEAGDFQITWANFPVLDETRSPCIDAGDPAMYDPDGTICDMGALYFDQGGTGIPGGYVSGTWTAAGSPYRILGEITVHGDSMLTIEPAVEVNFQGHYKFIVEGILQAVGTEQDSILFTAAIPDSGWRGIRFETAPDGSQLSYCILQYGRATVGVYFLDRRGGGIYSHASRPEISHCTVRNCFADYRGGGIYIDAIDSFPPVSNCTITGNSAESDGGGIYMATTDSVTFSNCTISNNSAGVNGVYVVNGGGIYFSGGHITISGCNITGNDSDDDGGGLYLESPLYITNSNVSDNSTNGAPVTLPGEGAGIYTDYSVTMDSSTVTGNQSITRGSGIFAVGALNLANSIISGNTADSDGAIHFSNGGGSIENCVISDNQGTVGGVRLYNANLVISGCSFNGNIATGYAGALQLQANSTVQLSYCTFSGNVGTFGAGGIYLNVSQLDVDHCTFASNAADSGGAFYISQDSNIDVTNSIFSDNSPNAITRYGGGAIDYSDFFGNGQNITGNIPAGFGELTAVNTNDDSCDVYSNIFLDPLFEDPGASNYQITWANFPVPDETRSPCIDAGDPAFALDPDSTITDMGRYFYDQSVTGIEYNTNRQIPDEFCLQSPYPNPFNPVTTFKVELPVASWVTIEIFDVSGRSLGFVVDGWRSAGYHEVTFDAAGLASGLYVYRLEAGDFNASGKMVLMK